MKFLIITAFFATFMWLFALAVVSDEPREKRIEMALKSFLIELVFVVSAFVVIKIYG